MKVSIVIPLFNKVQTIHRTLVSIAKQIHSDYEVLVINDGSTDGSDEIVRKFKDNRFRLINKKNKGVSAARNDGIKKARYPLISFIDGDDEWLPEFLSNTLYLSEKYPEAGFFCANSLVCKLDKIYHPPLSNLKFNLKSDDVIDFFKLPIYFANMSSLMVRKKSFEKAGLFNEKAFIFEDIDMLFRLGIHFPIAYSTKYLSVIHTDSLNRSNQRIKHVKWIALEDSYLSLFPVMKNPVRKHLIDKYYFKAMRNFAINQYLAGYRDLAFSVLSKIKKNPTHYYLTRCSMPLLAIERTLRAKAIILALRIINRNFPDDLL
jgi:glycosyltransferase involved in cell wall biosynthesis